MFSPLMSGDTTQCGSDSARLVCRWSECPAGHSQLLVSVTIDAPRCRSFLRSTGSLAWHYDRHHRKTRLRQFRRNNPNFGLLECFRPALAGRHSFSAPREEAPDKQPHSTDSAPSDGMSPCKGPVLRTQRRSSQTHDDRRSQRAGVHHLRRRLSEQPMISVTATAIRSTETLCGARRFAVHSHHRRAWVSQPTARAALVPPRHHRSSSISV